jgi:hypothetical protein
LAIFEGGPDAVRSACVKRIETENAMARRYSSELEALRWSIRPEDTDVSQEELVELVDSALEELPEGTAEDFMKSLGSIGKAIAPALQRAAPSIVQGAATGASVGGPWGALVGAGVGLGKGVAGGPPKPAAPPPSAGKPAVSTLPTGPAAAATLLSLLQNPAVQRALVSQVLGASGSPKVTTASGTDVPRAAINGLLAQLLANASEGLDESESEDEQAYLQDDSGEYLIDPASPEQQGALVLARLQPDRESAFDSDDGESDEAAEWAIEAQPDEWVEFADSVESMGFY